MAGDLEGELVGDLETVHDERRDAVLLGKFEAAHAHLVVDDQKIERDAGGGGDFQEPLLFILAADRAGFEAVFRQRPQRGGLGGEVGRDDEDLAAGEILRNDRLHRRRFAPCDAGWYRHIGPSIALIAGGGDRGRLAELVEIGAVAWQVLHGRHQEIATRLADAVLAADDIAFDAVAGDLPLAGDGHLAGLQHVAVAFFEALGDLF